MPRLDTARYHVSALTKAHDRTRFESGNASLDRYLHEQASQDVRRRLAAVFVLCETGHRRVVGYYTLSALSIDAGELPASLSRRLPRYPQVPATLLGRLAVALPLRGQGAGEYLLVDALHRALAASVEVASLAVVVDAKDDAAESFYRKYGFIRLIDHERRLFLPMSGIAQSFAR